MIAGKVSRSLCVLVTLSIAAVCRGQSTCEGYTFVFSGKKASLYAMDKKKIHEWTSAYSIVGCADLLRDSSVILPSFDKGSWTKGGALAGGRFQVIRWDGTVTWDYLYRSAEYMPHHDIEPVYYTNDPAEKPNFLVICYTAWGDKITELKPTGLNTAEVVWEWYGSDHSCPSGTGSDKPELLDRGKGGSGSMNNAIDKMHTNSVSFNRTLNQLVISVKGYDEIMVIDHSTTTAEAKGHTGGKYGKGGDILYRWGNPANYGVSGTKYLEGQHGGCWVPDTFPGTTLPVPGAFNMMCVDNGNKRVVEITPPGTKNGVYPRTAGAAFAPSVPLWTHAVSTMQRNEGSVQRLPNGNTLICTGGAGGMGGSSTGSVLEVDSSGKTVWELTGIPISTEGVRYAYGYLDDAKTPVAKKGLGFAANPPIKIVTNPVTGSVSVFTDKNRPDARLSLFTASGRELCRFVAGKSGSVWNLGSRPAGVYFLRINDGNSVSWKKAVLQR